MLLYLWLYIIYIVIIEYMIYIYYDLYINSFTQLFHFLKDMAIDCVLYFGAEAIQVLKHIAASAVCWVCWVDVRIHREISWNVKLEVPISGQSNILTEILTHD